MSVVPNKISAYLRRAGPHPSTSFVIPNGDGVGIDASNFYEYAQGNPNMVFDFTEEDFFGQGYMRVDSTSNQIEQSYPSLSYPISTETPGNISLYIRAKMNGANFVFDIELDGTVILSETLANAQPDVWTWFNTEIVIPDTAVHKLTLIPKRDDLLIDALFLTQAEALPPDLALDNSPYVTVHAKIYQLTTDRQLELEMPVYDAKNTLNDILIDDWYNFIVTPLSGHSTPDYDQTYAFFLLTSGSNIRRYIIWDFAETVELSTDPYFEECSLHFNTALNIWQQDCEGRYAIRVFTYNDPTGSNGTLITPPSTLAANVTKAFNEDGMDAYFFNTKITDISASENQVELELPDRLLTQVIDMSGSMTWNDNEGLRFDLSRRMLNRLQSSYPGDIKHNLLAFGGTPIRVNFFAVVEDSSINTNDTSAVANAYFADQESGYAGVRVVRKKGSYPSTPVDGEIVIEGFVDRAFDDSLTEGTEYFYKVFTLNPDGIFSTGVPIKATPRLREIPKGVSTFTANVLKGTGVKLDSNVVGLWHFGEKTGQRIYDFTSNELHAEFSRETPPVWLNSNDVPVGVSGVRLSQPDYPSTSTDYFTGDDPDQVLSLEEPMTFMAWVQPFGSSYAHIFESGDENIYDWFVGQVTGNLLFTTSSGIYITSTATLTEGEWNHIAVTFDPSTNEVYLFINGNREGPFVSGSYAKANVTKFLVGNSLYQSGYAFAGKITEISVHNTIRSDEYIVAASSLPAELEDKALDNGDRLIVLNYSIPENYDYEGGNIRIVRKIESGEAQYSYPGTLDDNGQPKKEFVGFGFPPYHENDGDNVFQDSPSPGSFFTTISDEYIHGRKYHFRIFSQNALGNFSRITDSPLLSITIPDLDQDDRDEWIGAPSPALPVPQSATAQSGDRKLYLQWSIPGSDTRVKQVKVYYKENGFPVVTNDGVESAATLVFDGSPSQTGFVHRNLKNDRIAHYAIVTADRYGYISAASFLQGTPTEDADETGIPLLDVKKLRYEVVSEEALSLAWEQPVQFQKDIDCWFDDRVVIYAQITDEFGAPIQDLTHITIEAVTASSDNAGLAEDVFGETVDRTVANPEPETLFSLSTTPLGDGFVRGLLRTSADLLTLSASNKLSVELRMTVKVPDRENQGINAFEFYSLPIRVAMKNPWFVELVNHSGDAVEHLCKLEVPLFEPEFISSGGGGFEPNQFKTFDGCYVRKSDPIVARVILKYRDKALPGTSRVLVAVHEASDPQCDPEDSEAPPFVPGFSDRKSRTVAPPSTTMDTRNTFIEDEHNELVEITYCDVPLRAPRTPEGVMLFIKASHNGFVSRRKLYYVFENILRVELNTTPPNPDCIDVAEQFCTAYLIDPDNPTSRTQVPDLQIIRWTLQKGVSGKDRPFYSTDAVAAGPGVFSYLRHGTARLVFFGPACGVVWTLYDLGPQRGGIAYLPEMYAVKASLTYDQLQAFEELPISIYPIDTNSYFGARFLMELPDIITTMYADGFEYTTLKIARNPNSTPGFRFGACFRSCANEFGGTLFMLSFGQIVEVTTGDEFEMFWGDDLEINLDEEGEAVFEEGNTAIATANVNLSATEDTTNVYLRINKFIGPPQPETGGSGSGEPGNGGQNRNSCGCLEIPESLKTKPTDLVLFGRTELVISGESRFLGGGGSLDRGIPPTIVRLREPLDVRLVDIRRNGFPVEEILIDGVSEHTVVIEVTFRQRPVPDGTAVFLQTGGRNVEMITISDTTIFTQKQNDIFLNPTGDERSFASFRILPFSPNTSFSAQVQAESRYDKRGTVERSMTACLTIEYDASQQQPDPEPQEQGEINNVFASRLDRYDSVADTWLTRAALGHPRGALTLTWSYDPYGEYLFAIGGINGRTITAFNERYHIATNAWEDMAPIPRGRFYHMTVQESGTVYVMGGIGITGSDLEVLNHLYAYDPFNDEWTELSDMPTVANVPYGVAMGSAVVHNGKIYVFGGINQIGSSGSINTLNDRVLIYSIDADTWTYTDPFEDENLELYARIAPFAFAKTSTLHVTGGAITVGEAGSGEEQMLEYVTDSFSFDPSTGLIERDDSAYSQIPTPRYKGGIASIGGDHFLLGGGNSQAKVLKIFEKINSLTMPYSFTELADLEQGRNAFGMTSDEFRYVYVGGGVTSGRPPGFLQIKAKTSKQRCRLDGRESVGIDIELRDDVGERPAVGVRVVVRGYLVLPGSQSGSGGEGDDENQQNSSARENLVYPVVFTTNDFVIENGFGSTLLLPRSDDILRKMDEIKRKLGITEQLDGDGQQDITLIIREGETREPYSIRVQITVLDDFFYGQTVVDINDNEDIEEPTTPDPGSGEPGEPGEPTGGGTGGGEPTGSGTEFDRCRSITGTTAIGGPGPGGEPEPGTGDPITTGINQNSNNSIFDLTPSQAGQDASPSIQYYCDIDWIPQIVRILSANDGEYTETIKAINRLRNSIPFGGSPLFDGLVDAGEILLDETAQAYSKLIYVHTDNEENLSFASADEVIEDLQAIDGIGRCPAIINNFSVVFPLTLSALVARTDTDSLENIASQTGGQSQTVLDKTYIDEVLNNSIGRLIGSIGWGLYEAIIDLEQDCVINSIHLDFTLYSNTDGNWKISVSSDGYNFSDYSDQFTSDAEVDFSNLQGRYVKFHVELISGLSASIEEAYDDVPTAGAPALTAITINYSEPTESFIFINPEVCEFSAQQIIASVNATRPFLSVVDVGAATSLSHNWIDYATGSQPAVDQRGKIFIPVRTQQEDADLNEPLESIDGFAWKAEYGPWNFDSLVTIKTEDDEVIDDTTYRVYPRDGLVVFATKQNGPFIIDIENSANLRLGIRVVNRFAGTSVAISGFGFLYNTNVFLPPPLSERPPVASNVTVVPATPNIYSTISLSYRYFDLNRDPEDLETREIRWFINGVEREYLRDLAEWNNIANDDDPIWTFGFTFEREDVPAGQSVEEFARSRSESILRVGDIVYATVKPSDGSTMGREVRSPSVTIVEAPPFVTRLQIKGRRTSGLVEENVTTATVAFADYNFFSDGGQGETKIRWYVNGIQFKEGPLGGTTAGLPNNEIQPGEQVTGIVPITIGNELEVEIIPSAGQTIGNAFRSDTVTVQNDPPVVRSVVVTPSNPTSASNLQVTYQFFDNEISQGATTQSNQSSIRWLKALAGTEEFIEVPSLANQEIVSNINTISGEKWKAQVIPFDGVSVGEAVESNIVTIQ